MFGHGMGTWDGGKKGWSCKVAAVSARLMHMLCTSAHSAATRVVRCVIAVSV